jgi:hypothetical protein
MTSTEAAPDARPAAGLTKRLLELRPLLGLLLFVLYVVIRSAYSSFYGPLGLTPDDLGLGYLDLLAQSAIAAVVLLLLALLLVSILVLPVAGLEVGDLSLPTAVAALAVVALLLVLIRVDDSSAKWIVWIGAVVMFPVAVKGLRKRLARKRPASLRWRAGLAILAIAAVLGASAQLISEADQDAQLVKLGHPAHLVLSSALNQVRVTSWGAEAATLSWTTLPADPMLRALGHVCLMYLGQSGGTLFVYTPNQSRPATYRIPASEAAVRVFPGASCSPGAAQPMPAQ